MGYIKPNLYVNKEYAIISQNSYVYTVNYIGFLCDRINWYPSQVAITPTLR